jgi:ribosomal protein S18 acetylase RimI-like enzyme
LVHPNYQGLKLGKLLFRKSVGFCQKAVYEKVFLWTLNNLDVARTIYQANGFKLEEKKKNYLWGHHIVEEYYVLNFK